MRVGAGGRPLRAVLPRPRRAVSSGRAGTCVDVREQGWLGGLPGEELLDAVVVEAKKLPTEPKWASASWGDGGDRQAEAAAGRLAIVLVVAASSATTGRRVPAGACCMPRRVGRAASTRCATGRAAEPSPIRPEAPCSWAAAVRKWTSPGRLPQRGEIVQVTADDAGALGRESLLGPVGPGRSDRAGSGRIGPDRWSGGPVARRDGFVDNGGSDRSLRRQMHA